MRKKRLPETPPERSGALLQSLGDAGFRQTFLKPVGTPEAVDAQDGVRIVLDGGRTIHFRASGNAPELRCYTEARTEAEAKALLAWGLKAAARCLIPGFVGRSSRLSGGTRYGLGSSRQRHDD